MLPAWPVADLYSPAWTVVGSQLRSQVSWHAGVGQRRASHWLALLPTAASLASQIQTLAKQAWRILSLHHKSQQSRNSLSLAFLLHIFKKKKKSKIFPLPLNLNYFIETTQKVPERWDQNCWASNSFWKVYLHFISVGFFQPMPVQIYYHQATWQTFCLDLPPQWQL